MEKRLLTALVLSTVVLVVWQFFAPKPPEPPRPPLPIEAPVDAARAIEAKEPKPVDDRPVLGEKVGEESERALTLVFGTPGTAGSYRATFSNRGARLTELSTFFATRTEKFTRLGKTLSLQFALIGCTKFYGGVSTFNVFGFISRLFENK